MSVYVKQSTGRWLAYCTKHGPVGAGSSLDVARILASGHLADEKHGTAGNFRLLAALSGVLGGVCTFVGIMLALSASNSAGQVFVAGMALVVASILFRAAQVAALGAVGPHLVQVKGLHEVTIQGLADLLNLQDQEVVAGDSHLTITAVHACEGSGCPPSAAGRGCAGTIDAEPPTQAQAHDRLVGWHVAVGDTFTVDGGE